jgi:uncharacterized radical SAM superfamily protein
MKSQTYAGMIGGPKTGSQQQCNDRETIHRTSKLNQSDVSSSLRQLKKKIITIQPHIAIKVSIMSVNTSAFTQRTTNHQKADRPTSPSSMQ